MNLHNLIRILGSLSCVALACVVNPTYLQSQEQAADWPQQYAAPRQFSPLSDQFESAIPDTFQDPLGPQPRTYEELAREVQELREIVAQLQSTGTDLAVPATSLEPPPPNPTDLLLERTLQRGDFRGAFRIPGTDVSLRIGGFVKGDVAYDTGFVGTGIRVFPSTIALDGTAAARRAGRTLFTARQSQLSFDAQAPNTTVGRLRGYLELDFFGSDARIRHLYGEWDNLLGGETWSTFMDPAALPQTVFETAVAGGVFRRQPQFRLTLPSAQGFTLAVAVEQPANADFLLVDPLNDVRLERWPDLVVRLRKVDQRWGTLQTAAMIRGLGFEDLTGDEHLRTGWGFSTTARINTCGNDNVRLGFVGGRGIGSYLVGAATDLSAAAPDSDAFRTMENVGAFVGYQHFWSEEWGSNVGYGYSLVETTNDMPATAGRKAQNTWINLIWFPRPNFGVGLEYNYAMREVRDGTTGDNHRIHFTIQFGP